eukprot:4146307-Amphidinium_carterae.1
MGASSKRKAAPKSSSFVRAHNVGSDGKLSTNRRGRQLCAGWQSGTCLDTRRDGLCANDPNFSHQCAICLSHGHGADKCTKQPTKGKSKGKGKVQN